LELIVIEVKRTNQVAKKIAAKVATGECLMCNEKMHKRGLCKKHVSVFEYRMKLLPSKSAKKKYQAQLMEEGLLLDAHEITTLRRIADPFVAASLKQAR